MKKSKYIKKSAFLLAFMTVFDNYSDDYLKAMRDAINYMLIARDSGDVISLDNLKGIIRI